MRPLLIAILLLAATFARAEPRHYAVLSLVGDQLSIVRRENSTGTRLDANQKLAVKVTNGALDRAMLLATDEAIRKADPAARPVLLTTRDPALYAAAERELDTGATARVFEAVRPVVVGAKATHLVLVTKHRHRAMLRLTGGHVGSGWLEGLGFYLDGGTGDSSYRSTDAERGFIAPYTYFKVSLIDLARGIVIAEDYAIGSSAHAMPTSQIGNAWKALSDEEKDRQLTQLMREETARLLPKLIGAA